MISRLWIVLVFVLFNNFQPNSSTATTSLFASALTSPSSNDNMHIMPTNNPNTKKALPQIKVLAVTGLAKKEWSFLRKMILKDAFGASFEIVSDAAERFKPLTPLLHKDGVEYFGGTGRVIILQLLQEEPVSDATASSLKKAVDEFNAKVTLLILEGTKGDKVGLYQPVYLHTQTSDSIKRDDVLQAIVEKGRSRGLFSSFFRSSKEDDPERFIPSKSWKINQHIFDEQPTDMISILHHRMEQTKRGVGVLPFPDWGTVAIFDSLVTDDLRARLLKVIKGPNGANWDDITNGPDPSRWKRGGVVDIPGVPNNAWGMADVNLLDVLMGNHAAMNEMESLIAELFRDYHVARIPILDMEVTPINVNAPTRHDSFTEHFDANPLMGLSMCMFTDIFGKFNNRTCGKPRFVSVLLYLNDEWNEEWGAPTSFRKFSQSATPTTEFIAAQPGRVVVMDSDVWHSVNPPTDAAGERARYSMVWRLVLYPKHEGQDMRDLQCGRSWATPTEILK